MVFQKEKRQNRAVETKSRSRLPGLGVAEILKWRKGALWGG